MSTLEQHPQWESVSKIHETLIKNGYEALIAGGAVRDLLLQRRSHDIDIATDATPDQVEALFEKTVMVGRQFGVARVIMDGHDVEVATFRKDGAYEDGRKPTSVEFCSAKEDALRRDFTINGMFYDPLKKQVLDYVGGQKDIMQQLLRTIGSPSQRFEEDKLRMLRAIRFHGQLNFNIQEQTIDAIRKHSIQIHQVSRERIRDEWQKTLMSEYALSAFQKTMDSGLWKQIFPKWDFRMEEYKKHWSLPPDDVDKAWTLWFLIHPHKSVETLAELLMEWKFSNKLIKKILYTYQSTTKLRDLHKIEPVDLAIFLSKPNSRFAVQIYQQLFRGRINQEWHHRIHEAEKFFTNGELPKAIVNGDDLIQYGVKAGPKVAENLKMLYRIQLQKKLSNKEELLKRLSD